MLKLNFIRHHFLTDVSFFGMLITFDQFEQMFAFNYGFKKKTIFSLYLLRSCIDIYRNKNKIPSYFWHLGTRSDLMCSSPGVGLCALACPCSSPPWLQLSSCHVHGQSGEGGSARWFWFFTVSFWLQCCPCVSGSSRKTRYVPPNTCLLPWPLQKSGSWGFLDCFCRSGLTVKPGSSLEFLSFWPSQFLCGESCNTSCITPSLSSRDPS